MVYLFLWRLWANFEGREQSRRFGEPDATCSSHRFSYYSVCLLFYGKDHSLLVGWYLAQDPQRLIDLGEHAWTLDFFMNIEGVLSLVHDCTQCFSEDDIKALLSLGPTDLGRANGRTFLQSAATELGIWIRWWQSPSKIKACVVVRVNSLNDPKTDSNYNVFRAFWDGA